MARIAALPDFALATVPSPTHFMMREKLTGYKLANSAGDVHKARNDIPNKIEQAMDKAQDRREDRVDDGINGVKN